MKIRIYLLPSIFLMTFVGCSGSHQIDSTSSPISQALELTDSYTPTETAESIVRWMTTASVDDREFARSLTKAVLSIYDSIDSNSGREFIYAIDSIKETLPVRKLAKAYTVACTPWRLGVILRENGASENLVKDVEEEYSTDSISLEYFREAYYQNK